MSQLAASSAIDVVLSDSIINFSNSLKRTLESHLSYSDFKFTDESYPSSVADPDCLTVSVIFTGTLYGEFLLTMNMETARKLINKSPLFLSLNTNVSNESLIIEIFSELMNIACGSCIHELASTVDPITMTAPRIVIGKLFLPQAHTISKTIQTEAGLVHGHIYIDTMDLEISKQYTNNLEITRSALKEREIAMQKMEKQKDLLIRSEKMAALGKMAAGIAHEINNPLSVISVVNSNIRKSISALYSPPVIFPMIDRIDSTVERIAKITSAMRTFAGDIQGPTELTSIFEVIKEAENRNINNLKQYNISVQIETQDIEVTGKLLSLTQAFDQLFDNSITAIKDDADPWIKISWSNTGDCTTIHFTDSGNKITSDVANKMFDPFFTTHHLKKKGIGLSIVQAIINDFGGTIRYDDSAPTTTFVIQMCKK